SPKFRFPNAGDRPYTGKEMSSRTRPRTLRTWVRDLLFGEGGRCRAAQCTGGPKIRSLRQKAPFGMTRWRSGCRQVQGENDAEANCGGSGGNRDFCGGIERVRGDGSARGVAIGGAAAGLHLREPVPVAASELVAVRGRRSKGVRARRG